MDFISSVFVSEGYSVLLETIVVFFFVLLVNLYKGERNRPLFKLEDFKAQKELDKLKGGEVPKEFKELETAVHKHTAILGKMADVLERLDEQKETSEAPKTEKPKADKPKVDKKKVNTLNKKIKDKKTEIDDKNKLIQKAMNEGEVFAELAIEVQDLTLELKNLEAELKELKA